MAGIECDQELSVDQGGVRLNAADEGGCLRSDTRLAKGRPRARLLRCRCLLVNLAVIHKGTSSMKPRNLGESA